MFLTLTYLVGDTLSVGLPKVFAILKVASEVSQRSILHGKPTEEYHKIVCGLSLELARFI